MGLPGRYLLLRDGFRPDVEPHPQPTVCAQGSTRHRVHPRVLAGPAGDRDVHHHVLKRHDRHRYDPADRVGLANRRPQGQDRRRGRTGAGRGVLLAHPLDLQIQSTRLSL